jgi:hypothetical protein
MNPLLDIAKLFGTLELIPLTHAWIVKSYKECVVVFL